MSKNEEGSIISNLMILKKFKHWTWILIFINIFTALTTIVLLGSMQQLYGKIQRLSIQNRDAVEIISNNFCLEKIKNVK